MEEGGAVEEGAVDVVEEAGGVEVAEEEVATFLKCATKLTVSPVLEEISCIDVEALPALMRPSCGAPQPTNSYPAAAFA